VRGEPDPTSGLDLLSVVVEPIADDCLGSVFVGSNGLLREGSVVDGIVKLFVISPVGATKAVSKHDRSIELRRAVVVRALPCDFGHFAGDLVWGVGFGRNLQLGLLEMISGLFPVFAGEFSTPSVCYVKVVIVAGVVVRGRE